MTEPTADSQVLRVADLVIDPGTRLVCRGDETIELPSLSFRLLWALAEAAPNVLTLDALIERVWDGRIVDPKTVTQRVKLLRQALGDQAESPRYVGLVRNEGYRMLPEVTPETSSGVAGIDRSPRHERFGTIGRFTLLALMVIGYFAVDRLDLSTRQTAQDVGAPGPEDRAEMMARAPDRNSIVVLPFDDLSIDGDHAYLSDGIAGEVQGLLSRIPGLRVISRTTAFSFRDSDLDIPGIAEQLGVGYVVEGTVARSADRLRISVQLVEAATDSQLWSASWDREWGDVFAIQDEIAASIAGELQVHLTGPHSKSMPTNPETYALYLQAKYLLLTAQTGGKQVEPLLRQALVHDPDYLPALNLMVLTIFANTYYLSESRYRHEDGMALMRSYVDRALAIDPDNSEALAHRGWMAFLYNRDLETAATYIERSLSSDPANPQALLVAGSISRVIRRHDDAIAFTEAALNRDPLCSECLYILMLASMESGDLDRALAASERRMRVAEGGWITRGNIHLLKGDARKALEYYENQKESRSSSLSARAIAFHELGEGQARDAALAELEQVDEPGAATQVAMVYAWRGQIDEAFAWLDRGLDPLHPSFVHEFIAIQWNPFFRNLRNDPRWLRLREQAGLGPERLEKIRIAMPSN